MAQAAVKQQEAGAAYNFGLFAPAPKRKEAPKVVVAPVTRRRVQTRTKNLVSILMMVIFLATLGSFVIATYAQVGELRREINQQGTNLTYEEANYSDLIFQLESKTNLNKVEQRAQELGLVKIDKSQVTYIRVVEENQIHVEKSPLVALWEMLLFWVNSMFGG